VHVYLPNRIRPHHIRLLILVVAFLVFPLRQFARTVIVVVMQRISYSGAGVSHRGQSGNENAYLKIHLLRLAHLDDENRQLRKALDFQREKKLKLVGTSIIAFDPSGWRRSVMLDTGTLCGAASGMFVINEDAALVGKITETQKNYSRLILLEDPDFNLQVYVGAASLGLLSGGLDSLKVFYVETTEAVKAGDPVWARIPGVDFNLAVGKVKSARKSDSSMFWDIEVEPYSKFSLLQQLFLIH